MLVLPVLNMHRRLIPGDCLRLQPGQCLRPVRGGRLQSGSGGHCLHVLRCWDILDGGGLGCGEHVHAVSRWDVLRDGWGVPVQRVHAVWFGDILHRVGSQLCVSRLRGGEFLQQLDHAGVLWERCLLSRGVHAADDLFGRDVQGVHAVGRALQMHQRLHDGLGGVQHGAVG